MDDTNQRFWTDPSINTFLRWLKIREENGTRLSDFNTLLADVQKSSLLRRLLAGKEPLPVAPPRKYAYPWYELVENGCAEESDVQIIPGQKMVAICQYAWTLLNTLEPGGRYIVRPYNQGPEDPAWELLRTEKKVSWDKANYFWKLTRLDA